MAQHVAAYLRISKSDDRSTSIDKQRALVRAAAAQRYPDVPVVEYIDDGRSASEATKRHLRAGLDRMLTAVASGHVRAVLVNTQDRLTRDRGGLTLWEVAEACEKAGADLGGASEDIDVLSASGEFTASLRANFARFEARQIAERMKASNRHRAANGLRRVGGNVVWGLQLSPDRTLVPHPERAPILLDVIDRVIDGTVSVRAAAGELTDRGIPTARNAAAWSHQGLLKILRSPTLAGMSEYQGKLIYGDDGLPRVSAGALLSLDRWHALQAALDARTFTRAPSERPQPLPLLHGLLVDSEGHRLYRRPPSSAYPKQKPRYCCNKPHCRAFASASIPALDDLVVSLFREHCADEPETVETVFAGVRDTGRLDRLRVEITSTALVLSTSRDPAEIAELATRLGKLRAAEADVEASPTTPRVTFTPTGRSLPEALEASPSDEERREILARRIDRVVLSRFERTGPRRPLADRVEVRWQT